ncbi:MAG: hypothetical protein AB7O97_17000 [Planctomycetota bacterium]
MDQPDTDPHVCPGRDLTARLQGERDRTHRILRASELELSSLTHQVVTGAIDYPLSLVLQVETTRRQLAAIDQVLEDLTDYGVIDAVCA